MTRKILMMTANPTNTALLKLNEEIAAIHEGLSAAQQRDQFQFVTKNNLNIRELRRMMLKETPQIVHFSGHGMGDSGIILQDDSGKAQMVSGEALAGLFELFADTVECVLLNACYSEVQAKAISTHIPYVIGMKNAIGDKAACEFAVGFYDALGVGKEIPFAFKIACNAIQLEGMTDQHLLPVLLTNSNAAQETPTSDTPTSKPRSTVSDLKRKRLEQDLAQYQQQYEAVSQQKRIELNAMNQPVLQHQLDELERKMQEIEQQLA